MRVDSVHMLHKEQPYVRSQEEAVAYLEATFPNFKEKVRTGAVSNSPDDVFVGVGRAFGCGHDWDRAIAMLMSDEILPQ